MYLLNLLFDGGNTDGIFDPAPAVAPAPGPPCLNASCSWLELVDTSGPVPVPVKELPAGDTPDNLSGSLSWSFISDTSTPLSRTNAKGHLIAVRIAPNATTALNGNSQLLFAASFGAPVGASTTASPFKYRHGGVETIFIFIINGPTGAAPANGWYVPLDLIAKVPGGGRQDRYEFSVGAEIEVTPGVSQALDFGIDPEMDIG
jgi:hypothetical protein